MAVFHPPLGIRLKISTEISSDRPFDAYSECGRSCTELELSSMKKKELRTPTSTSGSRAESSSRMGPSKAALRAAKRRRKIVRTYTNPRRSYLPRTLLAALAVLCLYAFVLLMRDSAASSDTSSRTASHGEMGTGGTLRGGSAFGELDAGASEINTSEERLLQVDFEVFGKVQKVYMRKYTKQKADELGVGGTIENTASKSVKGTIRGPESSVRMMQDWLMTTGSPKSQIDRAIFSNEREIQGAIGVFGINKVTLANGKQWA